MLSYPLTTERLLIRPFDPDDWRVVYTYLSDPLVTKWQPGGPLTAAQVQALVEEHAREGGDRSVYAVVRRAEGDLVGHIVFRPWQEPRTCEMGWMFHTAHQGKGYATEASLALIQYGFETLKLHRIIASCQPENVASRRVMEKVGMRREGHFRKAIHISDDIWWDELSYAILEEEWSAARLALLRP
jgi:RimJ/RimL family protein N-acetyltransferase